MDDDEGIRKGLCRMINRLGYDVEGVPEGAQALAAFRHSLEGGRPFAAALLDITVRAGIGGEETLAALRDLEPALPVIASTGQDPGSEGALEAVGFSAVLCKPYSLGDLSAMLSRFLPRT